MTLFCIMYLYLLRRFIYRKWHDITIILKPCLTLVLSCRFTHNFFAIGLLHFLIHHHVDVIKEISAIISSQFGGGIQQYIL